MAEATGERKLTVILNADVVDYSRLMQDDERATVRTLTDYREVFADHITRHHGRVVDNPGDNLLAEFASPIEAVEAATHIQRELARRNAQFADHRRMDFRIGINLGDVLDHDGALFGDGVNIAARLEGLADAGGICVSGKVHEEIEGKLNLAAEPMGAHQVKNIEKPVPAFRIVLDPGAARPRPGAARGRPRWLIPVTVAAATIVLGLVAWQLTFSSAPEQTAEPEQPEPVVPLSDKPVIAVLPFANLSQDADQEWFADGLTESLITDLAKLTNVLVIARNSVFRYKGEAVDVQQVSQELGANYIVEGSIQTTGDVVRINAQIIDGATGTHVWSERYDRELKEYFTLQDEIIEQIIVSLDIAVLRGERARLNRQSTDNLEAYEIHRRATELFYSSDAITCPNLEIYRDRIQEALELDPGYSSAYVGMGRYYDETALYGCRPPEESFRETVAWSNKAIEINPSDAEAYAFLSIAYMSLRDFDKFIEAGEKAFEVSPNNVSHLSVYGWGLTHVRQYERAKLLIEKALRLQPFHLAWWQNVRAMANFWLGDNQTALEAIESAYSRSPNHSYTLVYKAVILSAMASPEAQAAGEDLKNRLPDFTIDNWLENNDPFQNPEDAARIRSLLEAAGVD
jgi:adenylate cyclase